MKNFKIEVYEKYILIPNYLGEMMKFKIDSRTIDMIKCCEKILFDKTLTTYLNTIEVINTLKKKNKIVKKNKIKTKSIKKNVKTYLMKDNHNGLYKIGYSKTPKIREKTLQSEKPSIKMVKVWDCDIEKELHEKYKHLRKRGEWFELNEIQVRYICTHY